MGFWSGIENFDKDDNKWRVKGRKGWGKKGISSEIDDEDNGRMSKSRISPSKLGVIKEYPSDDEYDGDPSKIPINNPDP